MLEQTTEMANELIKVFELANDDDGVRVIVVTGAGKAFCAGMDLTSDGNVFGLNESMAPTMDDMEQHFQESEFIFLLLFLQLLQLFIIDLLLVYFL